MCDVHISLKVSKKLEKLGHTSFHANYILNKWHTTDVQLMKYADENDLILITKDQDFRNSFILGSKPKKLIKINLGNIPNKELMVILEDLLGKAQLLEKDHSSFMIEVFKTTSNVILND